MILSSFSFVLPRVCNHAIFAGAFQFVLFPPAQVCSVDSMGPHYGVVLRCRHICHVHSVCGQEELVTSSSQNYFDSLCQKQLAISLAPFLVDCGWISNGSGMFLNIVVMRTFMGSLIIYLFLFL